MPLTGGVSFVQSTSALTRFQPSVSSDPLWQEYVGERLFTCGSMHVQPPGSHTPPIVVNPTELCKGLVYGGGTREVSCWRLSTEFVRMCSEMGRTSCRLPAIVSGAPAVDTVLVGTTIQRMLLQIVMSVS